MIRARMMHSVVVGSKPVIASRRLCTKNTSWALIERPYSCAPQAVGAVYDVYDRPGFFVQSPVRLLYWTILFLIANSVCGFLSSGFAQGGFTYYVAPTGSDSNPGTSAAPWRTIQKAANTLNGGDTVIVNAGTYNERVQVVASGTAGKLLNFQAQGTVVMQGFNLQGNYVRVNGFEITNTPGSSPADRINGSGFYVSSSNNEISNNYVHNTPAAGIYLTSSVTNTTVSGN